MAGQPAGSARARRDGRRQDAASCRRRRGRPAPGWERGRCRGDHRLHRRRGRAVDERYRRRRVHGRPGAGRGAGGRRLPDGGPGGGPAGDVPLSGAGSDTELFGWPAVVDSANVWGYRSVAVPGTVAGLALALERWGTISLAEALAPAIRWAEEGVPVFWHTTLMIAAALGTLKQFPATAAIFLDGDGNPPVTQEQDRPRWLRQEDLARTLRTIASDGPRVMYEGSLGQTIADDLAANGAPFTRDDFASLSGADHPGAVDDVRRIRGPHDRRWAPAAPPWSKASISWPSSTCATLAITPRSPCTAWPRPSAPPLPIASPGSPTRRRSRSRSTCSPARSMPRSGCGTCRRTACNRSRPRPRSAPACGTASSPRSPITSPMPPSPGQMADGSTTHLSVMDRDGMAVSCTQTLLSLWGSRVTTPGTGVLLNNGMMWFDPEPGRPNSVAGGKTPLSNMAPVILSRDGRPWASLGASGGRRIMNCNAQLVINLTDWRLAAQPAISAPRIDCSTAQLLLSWRFPAETVKALRAMGHRVAIRDERLFTDGFASPTAIRCTLDGVFDGGADPFYAPATAQAAHGVLER